LVPAKEQYANA